MAIPENWRVVSKCTTLDVQCRALIQLSLEWNDHLPLDRFKMGTFYESVRTSELLPFPCLLKDSYPLIRALKWGTGWSVIARGSRIDKNQVKISKKFHSYYQVNLEVKIFNPWWFWYPFGIYTVSHMTPLSNG